jgi:hypothetical protein
MIFFHYKPEFFSSSSSKAADSLASVEMRWIENYTVAAVWMFLLTANFSSAEISPGK